MNKKFYSSFNVEKFNEKEKEIFFGRQFTVNLPEATTKANEKKFNTSLNTFQKISSKIQSDCIINSKNKYKNFWSLIILFLVAYSCFTSAF